MSTDRTRNKKIQNPKKIILIASEGDNKTEKNYFSNYNDRDKNYIIKYSKGNETDPINLVKNMIKEIKKYELDLKGRDQAFCVFDTDTNINKNKQIKEAKK